MLSRPGHRTLRVLDYDVKLLENPGKTVGICKTCTRLIRMKMKVEHTLSLILIVIISHQNEWRHSSSTLSLEEASDLQALFNNVMVARLHSSEGRLEFK